MTNEKKKTKKKVQVKVTMKNGESKFLKISKGVVDTVCIAGGFVLGAGAAYFWFKKK